MIQEDVRKLFELADQRDAARQAWLRHLHLLAAGALTLLAGMDTGSGTTGMAQCWLRATWAALGLAILCGGAALYGETAKQAALARQMAAELQQALAAKDSAGIGGRPVIARRGRWIRAAEAAFVTSLCIATISLVAFALSR